ncbi:heterokaryon incompatibility Het-C [Exidia glandulosa HHB12029]|uniref:Heterokaryon incompatibility Het-C n=1 Tax=Exidia glandulosa HHB12029 TaxID=1314781 RepID=A0A165P8E4_EXIGL|nr:heterokaryon incompatibility Het-C [Exidia glandulosa HHB12029]
MTSSLPLVLLVVVCVLPLAVHAFGAGDIPDFAFLNDKAFRHGDIENVLVEIAKFAGHAAGNSGLFSFARSVMGSSGGKKFSKEDVKKVYFGNWLRDYSQVMDIGGLSKLSADTLVMVVSVLGFLEFGFATEEFEVTPQRLGVYLPVEHIDNPRGYAEVEGDARQFHPWLRPPVNPRELEIDPRTGMKNYMATEDGGWDTSTLFIRRSLRAAIDLGRRSGLEEGPQTSEAFRLMGQALHTLEDLLAHSNWCEVSLRRLGYSEVFCHVGDNVWIDTPNGPAPPLVTGTFTSRDLVHSLLGEASDHLSQTSMVDLSKRMDEASSNDQSGNVDVLRTILGKVMGGGGADDKMGQAEEMQQKSKAYHFDPDNVASPEVQKQLWDMLKWRDGIMREIIKKLEMIPGLTNVIDQLSDSLNAYVYTLLAPYLSPILEQVTGVLGESSQAVIDSEDQFEVFNNPHASDPTHSVMSKDHFALILNEPAGKVARVVVMHAVNLIVQAWSDTELDPDAVITTILEAFHHPYYATGNSRIQNDMAQELQNWVSSLDPEQADQIIAGLTKEAVREGMNKRLSEEEEQQFAEEQAQAQGPNARSISGQPQMGLDEIQGLLGGGLAGFAGGELFGALQNRDDDNEQEVQQREIEDDGNDPSPAWREREEPEYEERAYEPPEESFEERYEEEEQEQVEYPPEEEVWQEEGSGEAEEEEEY